MQKRSQLSRDGDNVGVTALSRISVERATNRNHVRAQVYINLGVLHAMNGDSDAAEKCFQDGLIAAPANADIGCNYGWLLNRQGRFGDAIPVLEQARAADAKHSSIRVNLAEAFVGAGQIQPALAEFDVAIELRPGDAGLRARRAEVASLPSG